ncbi:MAG: hypothetical protein VYA67_22135 [Actinomycetota bacterium]|nr:hypothetical protein [Actinomycetota bacterium]
MTAIVRTPDHRFQFEDWRIDTHGDRVSMTMVAADGTSVLIDDRRNAEFLLNAATYYLRACDRADEFARWRDEKHTAITQLVVSDDEYALRNIEG